MEQFKITPDISNEKLAEHLEIVPIVEKWIKDVKAMANARAIENGEKIPGMKVVEGGHGARTWSDDDDAEKMLKSFRLKQQDMYVSKLISAPQAEKLAKEGIIKEKQYAKLEDLIRVPPAKLVLVSEDDPRPEYQIKPPADDLPDLTQSDIDDLFE